MSSDDSRTYVIKFGGNVINTDEEMAGLAEELLRIIGSGDRVIVVHGGGPEISRVMEERGLNPRKVAGVRVTDEAVLAVAEEVLSSINSRVVAAFRGMGLDALGMAGHTDSVITCARKPPLKVTDEDGNVIEADLGLVGEVSAVDGNAIHDVLLRGKVPVIYPICETDGGVRMNVNADTLAYGVACALGCDELIMVTDVPGVLMDVGDPASLRPDLGVREVRDLIGKGIIRDGMVPKVEGCIKALEAGVRSARMVNGKDEGSILGDLAGGSPKGTRIHE